MSAMRGKVTPLTPPLAGGGKRDLATTTDHEKIGKGMDLIPVHRFFCITAKPCYDTINKPHNLGKRALNDD